jgi:hypothetical protein
MKMLHRSVKDELNEIADFPMWIAKKRLIFTKEPGGETMWYYNDKELTTKELLNEYQKRNDGKRSKK